MDTGQTAVGRAKAQQAAAAIADAPAMERTRAAWAAMGEPAQQGDRDALVADLVSKALKWGNRHQPYAHYLAYQAQTFAAAEALNAHDAAVPQQAREATVEVTADRRSSKAPAPVSRGYSFYAGMTPEEAYQQDLEESAAWDGPNGRLAL